LTEALRFAQELVPTALTLAVSTAWPPSETGAFWAIVAIYGVVSVLFDDETPRGVPGMEDIRMMLRHPPPGEPG
jgi:hypothetical protein